LRLHTHRHPEILGIADYLSSEITGHYTNHSERVVVNMDDPANHAWIAIKPALPEFVTDHGDWIVAGRLFIFGPEGTARNGVHSQHGKEISAYDPSRDTRWGIGCSILIDGNHGVRVKVAGGSQVLESILISCQLLIERLRE
jgi:hypothetical protein